MVKAIVGQGCAIYMKKFFTNPHDLVGLKKGKTCGVKSGMRRLWKETAPK